MATGFGLRCAPRRLWIAMLGAALASPAWGDDDAGAENAPAMLDRLVVVSESGGEQTVGGAVHLLDAEILGRYDYTDVNRMMRQVPGVFLQEEDGHGLRPNIGIRGSGSDRSSRIAVMEDGVLIAPAPYAAPAAYYFPRAGRMHAIEISKGPAAIKYGPQTVGGAVNLFSTPVPGAPGTGPAGRLEVLGGEYDTLRTHGVVGGYVGDADSTHAGVMFEAVRESTSGFKRLDGGGDTGFLYADYVAKLSIHSGRDSARPQSLEFKIQSSDERSNETYLGLTLDDFGADPYRRYAASQRDVMDVDHRLWQATHRIALSDTVDLTTVAYRTETARAWYKLNDVGGVGISAILADPAQFADEYEALVGNSAPGALRVRNNNREYEASGIQSVLGTRFATGALGHDLEFSVRFHHDEEDRFQNDDRYTLVDGVMVPVTRGAPGSQDNRVGEAEAWAFFVRDTIEWGDWTVTPGLRYERIELTRTDYSTSDPSRADGATQVRESDVDVWIPGLGVTWRLNDSTRLLAGAHRGFASPGPGSDVDAETSINYEAGVRHFRGMLALEAIAFLTDYSNLVGTCTASTGGGCDIGDQYAAGEASVHGVELSAHYEASAALGLGSVGVPLDLIYTWTRAEFDTSFSSDFGPWGDVERGDEFPYVPEHQVTFNAGLAGSVWRTNMTLNWVDEARAVAGRGPIGPGERIDSRLLVDLTAEFDVADRTAVFLGVENMTDKVYNVAFSPAGARPGKPRTFLAGLKTAF